MTKTETLHEEVVATDHRLAEAVERAEENARGEQLKLDIHRYVWTAHPKTPVSLRMTQQAYADLVGIKQQTVSESVRSVERSIKAGYISPDVISVPSEQGKQPPAAAPTPKQSKGHSTSRATTRYGDEKTMIYEVLAEVFGGVTVHTVATGRSAEWKHRREHCEVRAREIATDVGHGNVWKRDVEKAAREIKAEFDLLQKRLTTIRDTMTAHRRGLGMKVTNVMVNDLYKRAVDLAERRDISIDEAIADRLEFDRKETDAERVEVERRATRNRYIREIEQGLAKMVAGGSQAEKAMRDAKGELDLTDDEIEDFSTLVRRAKGALNAIDLLITGEADWDDAARKLAAELGS